MYDEYLRQLEESGKIRNLKERSIPKPLRLDSRQKNKQLTLYRNLLGCRKYLSELKNMAIPEILDHLSLSPKGFKVMPITKEAGKEWKFP